MQLKDLQKQLDDMKYRDSKMLGKDLCGTYNYCKHCNKKNKYPCAAAFNKSQKVA